MMIGLAEITLTIRLLLLIATQTPCSTAPSAAFVDDIVESVTDYRASNPSGADAARHDQRAFVAVLVAIRLGHV
jgi:hypothetical protein